MNTSKCLIYIVVGTLIFSVISSNIISFFIAFFLLNEGFLSLYKASTLGNEKRKLAFFYWMTYVCLLFSIASCFTSFQNLCGDTLKSISSQIL